ncbi:MAG: hypothetical protein U0K70_00955 [Acutalibacteraceae bacterium]|nr:hypothetical protein [Acutalibacteraceae bacterium]
MVILFSGRKSAVEKEIIEILCSFGANYISDKAVSSVGGQFTVISEYKKTDIKSKSGIAVFIDDTDRFKNQFFPKGIIGICEDGNLAALKAFKDSETPVITCGMGAKNTVTLSSFGDASLLASLQRTVTDFKGQDIDPAEFKIKLTKRYSPFAVMASAAVLLLIGIKPDTF